jgi:hypothetical protein
MTRRSAPDRETPAAAPRPKGTTTTTPPTRRRRRPAGPVETAMTTLITQMRTRDLLTIAGEVTGALAIAQARALDTALADANAYGCRQAHLSLIEVLDRLRDIEHPTPDDDPDPIDELLASFRGPPTKG